MSPAGRIVEDARIVGLHKGLLKVCHGTRITPQLIFHRNVVAASPYAITDAPEIDCDIRRADKKQNDTVALRPRPHHHTEVGIAGQSCLYQKGLLAA